MSRWRSGPGWRSTSSATAIACGSRTGTAAARWSSTRAAPDRPFEGGLLGVDLDWRCAHELAALTLGVVAERAARSSDLDLALRVVRARMTLPVEHGEIAALRARLN